ncbi:MAG: hypothetical protein HY268_17645 [Deltaproteobacteria bacterium]|nr:hypothetical protein [Deltaproteobacteria bacterium]
MRLWVVVGLAGLFLPSLGLAENVKEAIQFLSTPEAECRYVATLVNNAKASLHSAQDLREEAEQLVVVGEYREATRKMIAAGTMARITAVEDMHKVTAATRAIRVKRGLLPACAEPLYEEGQKGVTAALNFASECAVRAQSLVQLAISK